MLIIPNISGKAKNKEFLPALINNNDILFIFPFLYSFAILGIITVLNTVINDNGIVIIFSE